MRYAAGAAASMAWGRAGWLAQVAVLSLLVQPATLNADPWAEAMPLARASLLLDVAREGSRIIVVGERGQILLSSDRAASWQQAEVPTRTTLTAVRMVGGSRAWAVGHDGLILHSDDGGLTWSAQRTSAEPDRPLLDLWFADASHGVAVGAYMLLLSTEDGGRTWRARIDDPDGPHANAIAEAPDGSLYVVGEFGQILRSDDRGRSWHRLKSPYEGSLFEVLTPDDGAILVFGLRGHLFRSEDRGASWRQIATGTSATLLGGLVRADGRIVVAGSDGALLVSADGGHTFRLQHRPDRQAIVALIELDPNEVLAVGEGGLTRIPDSSLKEASGLTIGAR